jgi:hypothetical protein
MARLSDTLGIMTEPCVDCNSDQHLFKANLLPHPALMRDVTIDHSGYFRPGCCPCGARSPPVTAHPTSCTLHLLKCKRISTSQSLIHSHFIARFQAASIVAFDECDHRLFGNGGGYGINWQGPCFEGSAPATLSAALVFVACALLSDGSSSAFCSSSPSAWIDVGECFSFSLLLSLITAQLPDS